MGTKSIGIDDKLYDELLQKAREHGMSLTELVSAIVAYGLPRMTVKRSITFDVVLANGTQEPLDASMPTQFRAAQAVAETFGLSARTQQKPPFSRPRPKHTPSTGFVERVRTLLREVGRPLTVIEIRRLHADKFPGVPIPASINPCIDTATDIKVNRETVPYTFEYSPGEPSHH